MRNCLGLVLVLSAACGDQSSVADAGALDPEDAALEIELCSSLYLDVDGDGHYAPGSDEQRSLCTPDAGTMDSASMPDDCDDHDPARWRRTCADVDGDGLVAFRCAAMELLPGERRCPVVVEWTPEPGPYDCNDDDPTLLDYGYRDLDGDGIGAGERQCLGSTSGGSAYGMDCDDADATRSPRHVERFGDGVDSDCDGSDASACIGTDAADYEFADAPIRSCEGIQLALGVLSCSACFEQATTFAVKNRSPERVQASVRIVPAEGTGDDLALLTFAIDLAPHESVALVTAPVAGMFELEVVDGVDCHSGDNHRFAAYGHCI